MKQEPSGTQLRARHRDAWQGEEEEGGVGQKDKNRGDGLRRDVKKKTRGMTGKLEGGESEGNRAEAREGVRRRDDKATTGR